MKKISEISLKNKNVLVRVDFNVPLDNRLRISDDSRIVRSLPTIKKVITDGGRAIIMSHLGRPKGKKNERFSLIHIVDRLSNLLGVEVAFSDDCIGKNRFNKISEMKNGDVLVLENLRFYSEEIDGDRVFAKKLSKNGDIYINDAFGASHRPHASTSIIANFFPEKKYFGFLMENELASLKKVLKNPKRPLTAIIGGAKITGKIDVISA